MTRFSPILLCGILLIAGQATAAEITAIKASATKVVPGAEVRVSIELSESSRCGVLVNFGDGSTQELKIESATSGTVTHPYQQPGNYVVTVQGKTIWRGLNTFAACDGTIAGAKVSVEFAGTAVTQTALSNRTEETRSSTRGVGSGPALTSGASVGQSGKRIALVIGNDAYEKVTPLQKAGNDATAMTRELKAAGFKVLEHHNLNYRGMVKAVEALVNNITGGDQVVVFFSGHGVQLKTGNYLLPTDIEASSESEIEKMAYGLDDLTEKLKGAKPSFTLVMVDACRDNPIKTKGSKGVGGTRGLSPIEPPKGQMVVYSASKGQQALDRMNDNDKNPNGVFTREFIARMKRPGVRIEDLVREVQDAVEELASTISHEQRPAIYNEAKGNFYFYGPTTVQTAPQGGGATAVPVRARTSEEIEDSYWDRIKDDRDAVGFEEYLKQYPKGRYAGQARLIVSKLHAEAEKMQREQTEGRVAEERARKEQYDMSMFKDQKFGKITPEELKAFQQCIGVVQPQVMPKTMSMHDAQIVAAEINVCMANSGYVGIRAELSPHSSFGNLPQLDKEAASVAEQQRKAREEADRKPQIVASVEWAESDNGSDISWAEAKSYCAGKGSGWRLPTVAELQSSYKLGQSGPCGRWTCKVASKSRLTGPGFWSSEPDGSSAAWLVALSDGNRIPSRVEGRDSTRALCVRRP